MKNTITTFLAGLLFLSASPAMATLTFCGGTDAQNIDLFHVTNAAGSNPAPVNGSITYSGSKGFRHPTAFFSNGGFPCSGNPGSVANGCTGGSGWTVHAGLNVCSCQSFLKVVANFTGIATPPTQNIEATFLAFSRATTPVRTNQDVLDFQNFPNASFNASYSKFLNFSTPGAWNADLIGADAHTLTLAGNPVNRAETVVRILTPYNPTQPLETGDFSVHAYSAVAQPLSCDIWTAMLRPINMGP